MRLKQGENKTIRFLVKDSSGDIVVLNILSSYYFDVKRDNPQGKTVIQKETVDFDLTSCATGVISVDLNSSNTNQTLGDYSGELKIVLNTGYIHKSTDIDIKIERAITTYSS